MAIYPRIKEEERDKIPEEHRCQVSYNGYHSWEVVRQTPASEPVLLCTKCLQHKMIFDELIPDVDVDKVDKSS